MIEMELVANFIWQSDWSGDEVGFPEVNVVGLYSLASDDRVHFYIDMETMTILDAWKDDEE